MDNKKSLAKINLQRIYIFTIRQYFPISCLNNNIFLICRITHHYSVVNIIRYVKGYRIQPAVITTFALSDLMALSDGLSLRTNTACR